MFERMSLMRLGSLALALGLAACAALLPASAADEWCVRGGGRARGSVVKAGLPIESGPLLPRSPQILTPGGLEAPPRQHREKLRDRVPPMS